MVCLSRKLCPRVFRQVKVSFFEQTQARTRTEGTPAVRTRRPNSIRCRSGAIVCSNDGCRGGVSAVETKDSQYQERVQPAHQSPESKELMTTVL